MGFLLPIKNSLAQLDEACVMLSAHDPIPGNAKRRLNHQPLNQKDRALRLPMTVLPFLKLYIILPSRPRSVKPFLALRRKNEIRPAGELNSPAVREIRRSRAKFTCGEQRKILEAGTLSIPSFSLLRKFRWAEGPI